ncbi:MAG: LCP family protein [Chloroflexota bacterium]
MRVETARARGGGKSLSWGAAILTGILVLAVVLLVSAAVFFTLPGSRNAAAFIIHPQPGSLAWNEHQAFNMLLLESDGSSGAGNSITAITVASYYPGSNRLSMLAIPTTLWVSIPGFGQGHIGEAYADGGVRLQTLTIEAVTHVPIRYYAVLGRPVLAKLVDSLGGLPVNPSDGIGSQMGGSAVLHYLSQPAGSREAVRRSENWQNVLLALKDRALAPANVFRIPALISTLGGGVLTNFPYNQAPDLAGRLASVGDARQQTSILDSTGNATVAYGQSGSFALLPNWHAIGMISNHLLVPVTGSGVVNVLNGSGVAGAASALSTWLQTARVQIGQVGSAASYGYQHTEILVPSHAPTALILLAHSVSDLLQVPLSPAARHAHGSALTVIIGADFQNPTQQ